MITESVLEIKKRESKWVFNEHLHLIFFQRNLVNLAIQIFKVQVDFASIGLWTSNCNKSAATYRGGLLLLLFSVTAHVNSYLFTNILVTKNIGNMKGSDSILKEGD